MSYIGLVYYEWKGKEYLMTFTAAKKLSKLLEVSSYKLYKLYNSLLVY